ncbi:MAG: type II toxin-antitoxin system PemK/MazF family toxin [Candidatus Delongbacteria bacterium]|nr:type II toxin-antitoxin system PemK/MazF family toxin [Candidatus Delongbacteria bacterium]MCG2761357.1 type II toxin-antitoxin system PemK/MazF family toxin [Candidatus Delongbacteria bacterium]
MAGFIKGDIVVVPFPFSDLSSSKKRPAYVACDLEGNDLILCQITTKKNKDKYSLKLSDSDFATGKLVSSPSNIRPNRIFTAEKSIIIKKVGHIDKTLIEKVTKKIVSIFEDT